MHNSRAGTKPEQNNANLQTRALGLQKKVQGKFSLYRTSAVQAMFDVGPIKPDIYYPFFESQASNFGEYRPKGRDVIPPHDIVERGLERFLHCIRCEFPILPEALWNCFLEAYQDRSELTLEDVAFLCEDGIAVFQGGEFPELSTIQKTAVAMAVENFWGGKEREDWSLRHSIAKVSSRPAFSVFAEDPATLECWEPKPIDWEVEGQCGLICMSHAFLPGLISKFQVSSPDRGRNMKVERLRGGWGKNVSEAEPYGGEDWTALREMAACQFLMELSLLECS